MDENTFDAAAKWHGREVLDEDPLVRLKNDNQKNNKKNLNLTKELKTLALLITSLETRAIEYPIKQLYDASVNLKESFNSLQEL